MRVSFERASEVDEGESASESADSSALYLTGAVRHALNRKYRATKNRDEAYVHPIQPLPRTPSCTLCRVASPSYCG